MTGLLSAIKPGMEGVAFAIYAACAMVMIALALGLRAVIRDTRRRQGGWGINSQSVSCPLCKQPAPAVRVPANLRQVLWGGFTCRCGCEVDKWGKAIVHDVSAK